MRIVSDLIILEFKYDKLVIDAVKQLIKGLEIPKR
jgi:hypothetical protein